MPFLREAATVLIVMSMVAVVASATALYDAEPLIAAMLLVVGVIGFMIGAAGAPA
jgi:hypothetical protein